jgi:ribosomal protein S18 acetylase RimI-like enzyme
MNPVDILAIDYRNPRHAEALIELMDAYASDPMGGGCPLNDHARKNLVSALAVRPTAFGVIAFAEGRPAGLVNCFEGFSTFACRPLANVHDLIVMPEFRGRGIAIRMLEEVERIARQRACCKLTLEVLEGNDAAQRLYRKFGFDGYRLSPEKGHALFWQKALS